MKNTTPMRYSLIGLMALTVLFSCKKDKDEDALKPPAERILGKWNLVKESEKTYEYNTGAFKDSSGRNIPVGIFTLEFRTDGKVYEAVKDDDEIQRDTLPYELVSESLLRIDGLDYHITKFTNTELRTTGYYDDGTSDVEHLLEFKK
jgi:hypothetical protein